MTSNLPFDEWTSVFGSERLTGALLDRLTYHVHILEMNGERLIPSAGVQPKGAIGCEAGPKSYRIILRTQHMRKTAA